MLSTQYQGKKRSIGISLNLLHKVLSFRRLYLKGNPDGSAENGWRIDFIGCGKTGCYKGRLRAAYQKR